MFFLLLSLSFGCSLNNEQERILEFEKEFYYQSPDSVFLYRSLDFITVGISGSTTSDELKALFKFHSLEPVTFFEHNPYDFTINRDSYPEIIILRIPDNESVDNFYQSYPKGESSKFGDQSIINFSLPVFNFQGFSDKANLSWAYPTNEVFIKSPIGIDSLDIIYNQLKLEFKEQIGLSSTNIYLLTDETPVSLLEIVRTVNQRLPELRSPASFNTIFRLTR